MVMLRTTKRLFHDKMPPVKSHMCVRIGSVLVRVVRTTRLVTSRQDDHSDPACSAVNLPSVHASDREHRVTVRSSPGRTARGVPVGLRPRPFSQKEKRRHASPNTVRAPDRPPVCGLCTSRTRRGTTRTARRGPASPDRHTAHTGHRPLARRPARGAAAPRVAVTRRAAADGIGNASNFVRSSKRSGVS